MLDREAAVAAFHGSKIEYVLFGDFGPTPPDPQDLFQDAWLVDWYYGNHWVGKFH